MDSLKNYLLLCFIFFASHSMLAQNGVGINTTNIATGSALQIESTTGALAIPRMTDEQMLAIENVLDGSVVFNTTNHNWYIRIDGIWTPYSYNDTPSIILNKENGSLTQTSSPLLFPLSAAHILRNSTGYYEVPGTDLDPVYGTIKILREGLYLVTAGMSTTNLPAGPKKYKILLYVNGVLASYLTSGNVNLSSSDYWGTSGNSPVLLKANDVLEIKYTLDGTGAISGKFFNIGISKL